MNIQEVQESKKGWRTFYVDVNRDKDRHELFPGPAPVIPGIAAVETSWEWIKPGLVSVSVREKFKTTSPTVIAVGDEVFLMNDITGYIRRIDEMPDIPPSTFRLGTFGDVKITVRVTDKKSLTGRTPPPPQTDTHIRPYSCMVSIGDQVFTVTFAHLHELKEYLSEQRR